MIAEQINRKNNNPGKQFMEKKSTKRRWNLKKVTSEMSFEETYALVQQIFQPHRKYGAEMRMGWWKDWFVFYSISCTFACEYFPPFPWESLWLNACRGMGARTPTFPPPVWKGFTFIVMTVYLPVPLMFVIATIMTSLALTSLWYGSSDENIVIKSLN